MDTWRSIRPPPYPPVKNVPALVSHDMMEGNRHTNKPKAMEDDDATLSADDFALSTRTTSPMRLADTLRRTPTTLWDHIINNRSIIVLVLVVLCGGSHDSRISRLCGCFNGGCNGSGSNKHRHRRGGPCQIAIFPRVGTQIPPAAIVLYQ